ncbi:putative membrane protein YkoI [Pseudoclavibacter chungangensis]|uniref:PepSY domain-containing protein n=1 Tax=Pseudoclavibacter chungangensis TaxID=587635 RepID=UPI0015C73070|nr:PepSY domain-containing protein [Pseudoclavibacter chungangensis]NYJ67339.1 putative membrane protein YkoI [Pseudoclavibacter chungangensis]
MKPRTMRTFAVVIAVGAATILAGCSNGGSPRPTEVVSLSTPESTTAATPAVPDSGGELAAAQAAIATAESHTGGRGVEIDHDDARGWSVEVVVGETTVEVEVSADGTSVVSTDSPDALDGDDRVRFEQVGVSLSDALATAVGAVPGTIDDAEVTEREELLVIEVEIVMSAGPGTQHAYIDAQSGTLVATDGS